jgi:quercetin dioxygenase-like cupin family protein
MKNLLLLFFLQSFVGSVLSQEVPVNKEPRHHPVFENKKVRILNVLLPPGDTSLYHLHSTPSVFISLSTTKTAAQLKGNQPSPFGQSTQGNIWFENLSPPHTRIHRVWNEDKSVFHVVDVELFTDDTPFSAKAISLSHSQVITDTPWVRVYRIDLERNEKIEFSKQDDSFLLITINDAGTEIVQNNKTVKNTVAEGDFLWINAGDKIAITNKQNEKASFALLEIK